MKISLIMRFILLIMPIVLIFSRPLSLAGRIGYGKNYAGPDGVMQVPGWLDAGPDALMQVRRCCDAGPRML